MSLALFVLDITFESQIRLGTGLSLLHTTLHILDELSKLAVLLGLLLEAHGHVSFLLLHLADYSVSLLELLFNNLQLLRVSKRIFRADNFFELVAHPCTFLHVEFDLYFKFCCLGTLDVALILFHLFILTIAIDLQIFDLPFQINHQMGVDFDPSDTFLTCTQVVSLLLLHQVIDTLIFATDFDLCDLKLCTKARVFVLQIVSCHALLHDIFVEAFPFLVDHSGSHLIDLQVDLTLILACGWQLSDKLLRSCSQGGHFLAELELLLASSCSWSSTGGLVTL